jgi:hypothetical protein
MHHTTVKLKDGRVLCGPIDMWRPQENWMSLMGVEERISFDDIASGETDKDRISIDTVGNINILERARRDVAQGRQHGWDGYPKEKFKWEN